MDINAVVRTILTAIRDLPNPVNVFALALFLLTLLALAILFLVLTLLILKRILTSISIPTQPRVKRSNVQHKGRSYAPTGYKQVRVTHHRLENRLIELLYGDTAGASRLIQLQKQKNPGMSQAWYLEKVIWDLERDRGK